MWQRDIGRASWVLYIAKQTNMQERWYLHQFRVYELTFNLSVWGKRAIWTAFHRRSPLDALVTSHSAFAHSLAQFQPP